MELIGTLLIWLINLYIGVVIIHVVLFWLIAFEVLNVRNPHARALVDLLDRLTRPVYERVQRFIPNISGIDISPIVVILGLELLKMLIAGIFF